MQRWATTLAGGAVVVLVIGLVARSYQSPKVAEPAATATAGDADAGADGASAASVATASAGSRTADSGTLLLSDLLEPTPTERDDAGGVGSVLLDGAPVPPLPPGSPKQVRFGVVMVSYQGAQAGIGGGGHSPTRSRADAKALADKLLATAEQDFHAAVQQGDQGSSDDVGRVKLGILEPAPEYILFTSPVHGVGGPVDTPRGYWIVKRLE